MVVDSETARQFIIFQTRHHKKTNVSLYVMEKHHFFLDATTNKYFLLKTITIFLPPSGTSDYPYNKERHLYDVKLLMGIFQMKNIT